MTGTVVYDPLDAATVADPFPVYDALRETDPVHWHADMNSFVLTRYADCREVLRNHHLFARDKRRVGCQVPAERLNIQAQDPPEQMELRNAVVKSTLGQDLEGICARAAEGLACRLAELDAMGDQFDFMADVVSHRALEVVSEFVGVDQPALGRYVTIFDGLTKRMDRGLDAGRAVPGEKAGLELQDMMRTWFSTTERPGMIRDLGEDPAIAALPASYVQNTVSAVFNAGFSTLYATTGAVVLTLSRSPETRAALCDESLLDTAVDELIRFESPAQGTTRWAVADTAIGDTEIRRGDAIVTLFAAANHDPEQFRDPHELVLDRRPNQHLGFGWGAHVCAGAQLALVWNREVIRALNRLPHMMRLAGDPSYKQSATLRTLDYLPMTFRR